MARWELVRSSGGTGPAEEATGSSSLIRADASVAGEHARDRSRGDHMPADSVRPSHRSNASRTACPLFADMFGTPEP